MGDKTAIVGWVMFAFGCWQMREAPEWARGLALLIAALAVIMIANVTDHFEKLNRRLDWLAEQIERIRLG